MKAFRVVLDIRGWWPPQGPPMSKMEIIDISGLSGENFNPRTGDLIRVFDRLFRVDKTIYTLTEECRETMIICNEAPVSFFSIIRDC